MTLFYTLSYESEFFKQSILGLLCLHCSEVGQGRGALNDLTKLQGRETLLG